MLPQPPLLQINKQKQVNGRRTFLTVNVPAGLVALSLSLSLSLSLANFTAPSWCQRNVPPDVRPLRRSCPLFGRSHSATARAADPNARAAAVLAASSSGR